MTTLAQIEREAIAAALVRHGGSRRRTGAELGIARSTLIRKLDEYGLRTHGAGAIPEVRPPMPERIFVRVGFDLMLHCELLVAAMEQGVPLEAYIASAAKDRAWSRMPSWTRNDPEENQEDLAWDGWTTRIMDMLSEIEAWGEEKAKRLFPRLNPGRRDWSRREVRIQPRRKRAAKVVREIAATPEVKMEAATEPVIELSREQKIEAIRARGFGRSRR